MGGHDPDGEPVPAGVAVTVPVAAGVPATSTRLPGSAWSRCTYPSAIGPNRGDLAALANRPVRIRFALRECDLYSFRFR